MHREVRDHGVMANSIGGAFAIGEKTLHSKVESLESTLAGSGVAEGGRHDV